MCRFQGHPSGLSLAEGDCGRYCGHAPRSGEGVGRHEGPGRTCRLRAGRRLTPSPPGSPPTGSARRGPGPGSRGSAPTAPRARLPAPRLPQTSQGGQVAESWGPRAGRGRCLRGPRAGRGRPSPPLQRLLPSSSPETEKSLVRHRTSKSSCGVGGGGGPGHFAFSLLGPQGGGWWSAQPVQSNGGESGYGAASGLLGRNRIYYEEV